MAENEIVKENDVQPAAGAEEPSKGAKVMAGIKEWFRKFVVKLKRKPMNIAFFVLIISTVVNLCYLGSYAQVALIDSYGNAWQGLCVFVNQLFCILSIMLFMNSFPKRSKKPKMAMLVALFVFLVIMVALDLYLYIKWDDNFFTDTSANRPDSFYDAFDASMIGVMLHMILVAVTIVLTATYPLYSKLINKINTRKVLESTELKEAIDTSEEV